MAFSSNDLQTWSNYFELIYYKYIIYIFYFYYLFYFLAPDLDDFIAASSKL